MLALLGTVGTGGCLRLTDTSSQTGADPVQTSTDGRDNESQNRSEEATSTRTQTPRGKSIEVPELHIELSNTGDIRGASLGPGKKDIISGQFEGDRQLFKHQTFARYAAEIVENGSVVAHTTDRIFAVGYRWRLAQTGDRVFITRQPGVREDWSATFRLRDDDWSDYEPLATQQPQTSGNGQVFEIDKTALDVKEGLYRWTLQIGEHKRGGTYITLIPYTGYVISIGSNPNDRTRRDAINYASSVIQGSSAPLGSYGRSEANGIHLLDEGGRGGPVGNGTIANTDWLGIKPTGNSDTISLGGGRILRIRNLATGTALTFRPS
ncbi:hypothetical protein ACFQJD_17680 [Haloplanus sp. GCM10025708]|uniref:hypothetical protein n=1 Tax=Haloferacaceae TaxID=1644056 RepID=UPI00361694E2